MTQSYQFVLKPSILNKKKTLIINQDSLSYKKHTFPKAEITEIRYGVKAIRGYRFNIGRIYCIDIKNTSGKIIRIRLKSLYGIRRVLLGEKYQEIAKALFENYFSDISKNYITMFINKVEFSILGAIIMQEGVKLNDKSETISWLALDVKRYWHYYSLFSISDSTNNKSYYYLEDWNAGILLSVIDYIAKLKSPG